MRQKNIKQSRKQWTRTSQLHPKVGRQMAQMLSQAVATRGSFHQEGKQGPGELQQGSAWTQVTFLCGQVLWSDVLMFIDQPWTSNGRPVLLLALRSDVYHLYCHLSLAVASW